MRRPASRALYIAFVQEPLISVIMPARNAEPFVCEAIDSLLAQSWRNWELLFVENGSTDQTAEVALGYNDPRVKVVRSAAAGLSEARNEGLLQAGGVFICFLDADDRLPPNSLESRACLLINRPDISFADGTVLTWNDTFTRVTRTWKPTFTGNPRSEMARLNPRCFCGITWMIRREQIGALKFNPDWSHLEDRLFFLETSAQGRYGFVRDETYHIRRRKTSLMSEHRDMERAFRRYLVHVNQSGLLTTEEMVKEQAHFHRMFFRTYAREGRVFRALQHFLSSEPMR